MSVIVITVGMQVLTNIDLLRLILAKVDSVDWETCARVCVVWQKAMMMVIDRYVDSVTVRPVYFQPISFGNLIISDMHHVMQFNVSFHGLGSYVIIKDRRKFASRSADGDYDAIRKLLRSGSYDIETHLPNGMYVEWIVDWNFTLISYVIHNADITYPRYTATTPLYIITMKNIWMATVWSVVRKYVGTYARFHDPNGNPIQILRL